MALTIEHLEFSNFRNYEHLDLETEGNLTVLVGKNATGKTNILEGIHLLTSANTFRHATSEQLICHGSESSRIGMHAVGDDRDISIYLDIEKGKRRYTVNGKGKNASDVRGIIPSVVFTPDDLELAKKSSSVRRNSIDNLGSQLSKSYYTVVQDYEKIIRYKNRLLKEDAPIALVESINDTLLTCGTQLYCYRRSLFERILGLVADAYSRIVPEGEPFDATYVPSWCYLEAKHEKEEGTLLSPGKVEEDYSIDKEIVKRNLEQALSTYLEDELNRKKSLVGPHNDKITFYLAGRDSSSFASQGQQRSIVLAWKIAEVEMTRKTLGSNPVLLLDDVMSELDESRRETLVDFVQEDIQTFITATDLSYFNKNLIDRAQVVSLPLHV